MKQDSLVQVVSEVRAAAPASYLRHNRRYQRVVTPQLALLSFKS